MTEPLVDQDFESKYGHLTRPLKEAAACWDIDLKDVILSFLDAQADDTASLDPAHMLNFAQAGMLVSSTATNYGRKVEHLYTLVYSTLDTMSKGEGKSLASNALIKRMRKRIVGFQEFENGFELLDSQFRQPAKGIDLGIGEGCSNGSHLTRRVPLLLLPREDSSDKAGNGKDNTAQSGVAKQSANGTEYKTSSCWVSNAGCLLLDPAFSVYEDPLALGVRPSMNGPLIPGATIQFPTEIPLPDVPIANDEEDLISEEIAPPSPEFGGKDDMEFQTPEVPSSPAAFPPLPSKRERVETPKPVEAKKPLLIGADPFAVLDPYAIPPNARNVKPRFGRCYQTPSELKPLIDMQLTANKLDLFSTDGALMEGIGLGGKDRFELVSVPGLENFKDILTIKIKEGKRKAAQATRDRRRLIAAEGPLVTTDEEKDAPRRSEHSMSRMSFANNRDSVGSIGGGAPDVEIPLTSTAGRSVALMPVQGDKSLQAERERIAGLEKVLESTKHMYDELMKRKLAEMIGADSNDDQWEDRSGSAGISGSSVAALVAAAGNSVQEKIPELYASIRRWQDNLEPLLEEQTSRPVFDLDDYLVSIIDKLKSTGPTAPSAEDSSAISEFLKSVGADGDLDAMSDTSPRQASKSGPISSFEQLVKGEPKWNVCRLFLSTLILTNNGNVEIFNDESNDIQEPDIGPASPSRSVGVAATPSRTAARTPAALVTPGNAIAVAGSPLRGSHTYGASHSFQVKLRNADKNLKFAIQDNASVVSGVIPILTNKDVPAPEPIGDVPFADDDDE